MKLKEGDSEGDYGSKGVKERKASGGGRELVLIVEAVAPRKTVAWHMRKSATSAELGEYDKKKKKKGAAKNGGKSNHQRTKRGKGGAH